MKIYQSDGYMCTLRYERVRNSLPNILWPQHIVEDTQTLKRKSGMLFFKWNILRDLRLDSISFKWEIKAWDIYTKFKEPMIYELNNLSILSAAILLNNTFDPEKTKLVRSYFKLENVLYNIPARAQLLPKWI